MKILKLYAERVKRLDVVEITPKGNLVTITGKNAQGKSSVLDSIAMVLGGGDNIPWEPVRKGSESAYISVDLGEKGKLEYRVTRRFTAKEGEPGDKKFTTSLTIEEADGRRARKPQELLDTIVGTIAFDPLEFSRMKPAEKVKTLRSLVPGVDFDEIADRRQHAFEERTIQNRKAKDASARASGIIVPPNAPDTAVDTAALMDRLTEIGKEATAIERERTARTNTVANIANWRAQAVDLQRQADELHAQSTAMIKRANKANAAYDDLPPLKPIPDATAIRAELNMAGELNAAYEKARRKADASDEAKAAETAAQLLTGQIEACDAEVQAAISAAKFPVRGLTFDASDVYLNGLPFDQAASSERLRASMALAMAANPKLRVMRVTDGGLLDDDAMEILSQVAEADDWQIWLEKISDGPSAIVMEDGRVKQEPPQ